MILSINIRDSGDSFSCGIFTGILFKNAIILLESIYIKLI